MTADAVHGDPGCSCGNADLDRLEGIGEALLLGEDDDPALLLAGGALIALVSARRELISRRGDAA